MSGTAALILAGVSAVTSLTSAGMSFGSAAKQRKASASAVRKSKALMDAAKKRMEMNVYEGLNVPLDAYDKQNQMNLLGQQTSIQALQEGDPRNLAAGVGAVGQVAGLQNEKMRISLQKDLYENRKMKADKRDSINQDFVNLGLGQAKQFAQEGQDLKENANAAVIAGISSIGEAAATASNAAPLYGKGKTAKASSDLAKKLMDSPNTTFEKFDEGQINAFILDNVPKNEINGEFDVNRISVDKDGNLILN